MRTLTILKSKYTKEMKLPFFSSQYLNFNGGDSNGGGGY
jgi:hypothetical protein